MIGMSENRTGMPEIRTGAPRNNGGCMLDRDKRLCHQGKARQAFSQGHRTSGVRGWARYPLIVMYWIMKILTYSGHIVYSHSFPDRAVMSTNRTTGASQTTNNPANTCEHDPVAQKMRVWSSWLSAPVCPGKLLISVDCDSLSGWEMNRLWPKIKEFESKDRKFERI